jgi:hypothetical protein
MFQTRDLVCQVLKFQNLEFQAVIMPKLPENLVRVEPSRALVKNREQIHLSLSRNYGQMNSNLEPNRMELSKP